MMLLRYASVDLPRRCQQRELGGFPLPRTILGKNVTVVGYGHVGSTLRSYLIHMGANVTAIRNRKWCHIEDADVVAKKLPCIKQALPTTDILILACTVTPATWHLINKEKLSLLQDGAIVVNIGRGPLVEQRWCWHQQLVPLCLLPSPPLDRFRTIPTQRHSPSSVSPPHNPLTTSSPPRPTL